MSLWKSDVSRSGLNYIWLNRSSSRTAKIALKHSTFILSRKWKAFKSRKNALFRWMSFPFYMLIFKIIRLANCFSKIFYFDFLAFISSMFSGFNLIFSTMFTRLGRFFIIEISHPFPIVGPRDKLFCVFSFIIYFLFFAKVTKVTSNISTDFTVQF